MLENGPFCKFDVRSASLLRRKSGCVTPSHLPWCIDRDHKKEVAFLRVMREVLHCLFIFLSGTRNKCLKMARFANSTYGARLFLGGKVAVSRPRVCLGESTAITKKKVVFVRVLREVSHCLVIFLSGTRKNA